MNNAADQDLVLQLQQGSLEALGHLYDRYQRMVYRTALVITGDNEAAADLLQDVFLRLYRFASYVDIERPLEPWLYRMTTNLSYTWVKRHQRWIHSFDDLVDWLSGIGRTGADDQLESRDEWQSVQKAITGLPLSQRIVIVLYYLNDLSLQEISDVLEVPVGTVKSRLHYGRLALKRSLGLHGEALLDLNFEGT